MIFLGVPLDSIESCSYKKKRKETFYGFINYLNVDNDLTVPKSKTIEE